MYNYLEAVTEDVKEYIRNNIDFADYDDMDELEEQLNDELWADDSVTGNGSGSYTFNRVKAEENLAGNWDELADALDEFGESDVDAFRKGAEWCDVTLRCYYLGQAISAALEDFEDEFEEAHQEEDED